MSSAIGDILQNPGIKASNADDSSDVSLLSRLLNSFNKGVAWAPDALINTAPKSAATLGDFLLNRIPGIEDDPLKKALLNANVPQDLIEKGLRKAGIIQDLPEATTPGGKLADSIGGVAGSLALPGGVGAFGEGAGAIGKLLGKTLLGTDAPLTSLSQLANPTFAGTAGGSGLQAITAPGIHDSYKDNPITETALNLLAGLLGGGASSVAASRLLPTIERALPSATAAQTGDINDPRTKELIARQLDLTKKDPKAADLLNKISQNQEAGIASKLNPETTISGQDIVQTIEKSIKDLKSQRSTEYKKSLKGLVNDFQQRSTENMLDDFDGKPPINTDGTVKAPANYDGVDVGGTLNKIDSLMGETATGSPLQSALKKVRDMVTSNSKDPMKLISAKSAIQDMTQPTNGLNLGTKQSAVLQQIGSQLNKDLENSMPGYADMNAKYATQTQQLNDLLDGVVGNVANRGADHPSQVVRQMFEKTDPALVDQLKQILPADVYNQAANTYLQDVSARGMQTPTKNTFNKISQFQKMGDILQKNRDTLNQTLPPAQNAMADQVIQDINQTALGRPRNDYTIGSRRGLAVGDEIKGLGALRDIAGYIPSKLGMNYLGRQEMLTGVSPMQQVTQAIGNQLPQTVQQGVTANALSDGMQAPQNQGIPQQMPPQAAPQQMPMRPPAPQIPAPMGQLSTKQGPSPIDDVLSKYGISNTQTPQGMPQGQAAANQNQTPAVSTSPPQKQSPIDEVMGKYGIGGNGAATQQQGMPSAPKAPTRVYSPAELDYLTKQLKGGNMDSVIDFDNSFKQYRQQDALPAAIRQRESSNNYGAENSYGYTGAYQFGAQALEDVGMLKPGASKGGNKAMNDPNNWTIPGGKDAFVSNQQLQDQAMLKLLETNKNRLAQAGIIDDNTPPDQVNGLLAVMHLKGMDGVMKLRQGQQTRDGYGTSTGEYYNIGSKA